MMEFEIFFLDNVSSCILGGAIAMVKAKIEWKSLLKMLI